MGPTQAGFLQFIRNVMDIDSGILPDDSTVIPMALAVSLAIVNPALQADCIPQSDGAGVPLNTFGAKTMYDLAVYNLAGSNLLSYATDEEDAPDYKNGLPFFEFARSRWKINSFVSGVVQASSDESTSTSLVVQDAAKNFTLANLQQLKDPYGRQYLSIAQSYGPSTWGIN